MSAAQRAVTPELTPDKRASGPAIDGLSAKHRQLLASWPITPWNGGRNYWPLSGFLASPILLA